MLSEAPLAAIRERFMRDSRPLRVLLWRAAIFVHGEEKGERALQMLQIERLPR